MPNCLTGLASYSLGCRETSGVQNVWGRPWSAGTVYTYDSTGIITGSTSTGSAIYNFATRLEVAEYHPGILQQSLSTVSYNSTLAFELHQYQATLRTLVSVLAKAEVEFFIQTKSGRYFILGEESGALLQESDSSLGKELNSMNGSTFSFLAKGQNPEREVSSSFFAQLTVA